MENAATHVALDNFVPMEVVSSLAPKAKSLVVGLAFIHKQTPVIAENAEQNAQVVSNVAPENAAVPKAR